MTTCHLCGKSTVVRASDAEDILINSILQRDIINSILVRVEQYNEIIIKIVLDLIEKKQKQNNRNSLKQLNCLNNSSCPFSVLPLRAILFEIIILTDSYRYRN